MIDLRVAEAGRKRTEALVGATDAFRESVQQLGIASQNLTRELAMQEGHERVIDRRANRSAALVAAIVSGIVSIVSLLVGGLLQ